MASNTEPLDLVDIAVLLNYERATTDERFANMKLREVAFPGESIRGVRFDPRGLPKDWIKNQRTEIVLVKARVEGGRQVPATMKMEPNQLPSTLSDQQLETIFHRIRAFDSCARVIILLETFFGLFSPSTQLRIRHAPKDREPGVSYITPISNRRVVTEKLLNPKFSTVIFSIKEFSVKEGSYIKYTGTGAEMAHRYMAFSAPDNQGLASVLDIASMQFGEAGRGPGEKGKMLIVLESKAEYEKRLTRIAGGVDLTQRKIMHHMIFETGEPEMDRVARKVKQRWEKRDTEKWCAHCGAPEPKFKCSVCEKVWFCNKEHQKMVWSFHKGYCKKD